MAIINPLNTYANTNAGGASGPAKNEMGKDTFFTLLITQLQNQVADNDHRAEQLNEEHHRATRASSDHRGRTHAVQQRKQQLQ